MVGPVTPQQRPPVRPDQVFVGRSAELGLLQKNLAWVTAGEPRVLVVEGPAGIGKSALVRAFLDQAGPEVSVRTGIGGQRRWPRPFGVVDQLLAPGDDPAPSAEQAATPVGTDPARAGARLVEVLGTLQEGGPVVVVIDDADGADAVSLRAVAFALRRLGTDRVLAIFTRPQGSRPGGAGMDRLVDARGQRLVLGGLDAMALAELAVRSGAGRLPAAAAARLRRLTGGSPLHATFLLEDGSVEALGGDGGPALSLASAVLSRLESCAAATRGLVVAAAVLGDRCSLPTAARLAGLSDPADALQGAVAARLLRALNASEGTISFPHPLIRAAIGDDLGADRARELHARAATMTSAEVAIGHRVDAAGSPDADLAAELAELAAADLVVGARSRAAAYLVAAARVNPEAERANQRILEAAGYLLEDGDTTSAMDLVAGVDADSPRRRLVSGSLAVNAGRLMEGQRLLEDAWRQDSGLTVPVAIQLGRLALADGRPEESVMWVRRALESLAEVRAPDSGAELLVSVGLALAGRGDEALAWLSRGPQDGPATMDRAERSYARGIVRAWGEDLQAAREDLKTVATESGSGSLGLQVEALADLAGVEHRLGRWDDSVAHGDLAASLAQAGDCIASLARCHSAATWVLSGRGEWERALAHVKAASAAAGESGTALDRAYAASARAQLAVARDDPAGVVAAIEPVTELWGRQRFVEPAFLAWREHYADALVSLGELDRAAAACSELAELARPRSRRRSLAAIARIRGRIEAAGGNLDQAESTFEEALAHLEGLAAPFARALVEDAHGRHLRLSGQVRAAAAHLRSALRTFTDLGAVPYADRCEDELAACGLPVSARPRPKPVSLSPLELGVAMLVASGKSERDVATELVVTTRTVGEQLRRVYTKLGVASPQRMSAALAGRDSLGSRPAI